MRTVTVDKDGLMVDAIVHGVYGRTEGTVEAVLEANPGLADLMPYPPIGTVIVLPDVPASPPIQQVRLWG